MAKFFFYIFQVRYYIYIFSVEFYHSDNFLHRMQNSPQRRNINSSPLYRIKRTAMVQLMPVSRKKCAAFSEDVKRTTSKEVILE